VKLAKSAKVLSFSISCSKNLGCKIILKFELL
jgi:hypothetical protein